MKPARPGVRVASQTLHFTSRAAISATIAMAEAAGEAFRTPLLRAAIDGELAVATATGGIPIPARILKQRRPTVALLADDHPGAIGPAAWPQARKLARWARLVALHATGGQAEHYAAFAEHAVRHGQLLIVEIELRHLPAWRDLVLQERRPGELLVIAPPPGGDHPISPTQAGEVRH